MRHHLAHIGGSITSLLGAVTANMEHFDFWFRQFGTLIAVTVGIATLASIYKKRNR